MKKRKILYLALGLIGGFLLLAGAFVTEQYYRWEVCNFVSRDGEAHSYLVHEGTSLDSVLNMLREDYDISAETDLKMHRRIMLVLSPEPGHYRFPSQIGDRELLERLKYGYQTPVRITWNHYVRTREELA